MRVQSLGLPGLSEQFSILGGFFFFLLVPTCLSDGSNICKSLSGEQKPSYDLAMALPV